MAAGKQDSPPRTARVDILGESFEGQALLVVEVKANKGDPAHVEQLRGTLQATNASSLTPCSSISTGFDSMSGIATN
jgi:RecB family endonuclease NucS